MAGGWGNNDNTKANLFDSYGFRRDELADFLEGTGVFLHIPLDEIKESIRLEYDESNCVEENVLLEKLMQENKTLKEQNENLKASIPLLLGKYRSDDPLLLAIEIRNSEWRKYDPENDRATRGNQDSTIKYLQDKGYTKRQAESIELVACPIKR
ncbi:hypothetical protein SerAS12_4094 [Serratia sp. AS12]|uniref:hypothetical protein n=1 Tax=Serratia TaxID=613 RepID=UPI00020E9C2B|nr:MULTISPECIES: hypothetical protein [Serratia]AEF47192.1 hypothetical protein SerAS9_4093 [Serratia plymuthica AS9]AEF52144.1 hypothetical protein SerAS12_4094 [Serratia sp. AS12]AEG29851.1 hypothetical protein SerAS13_4094 [Serratia sp. AS13]UTN95877.1 hypothetical protein NLX81_20825 [Serratia plymuthica]